MQDNKDYIDSKFINDSWKQLKSQLDADLPVDNSLASSKRYIHLLSGVLLMSLFSLAYISHLYFNQIPASNTTKEIIKYEKVFVPYYLESPTAEKLHLTNSRPINISKDEIDFRDFESDVNKNIDNTLPHKAEGVLEEIEASTEYSFGSEEQGLRDQILNSPRINSLERKELNKEFDFGAPGLSIHKLRSQRNLIDIYLSIGGFVSNLDYTGHSIEAGLQFPINRVLSFQTGISLNIISRDYFIFPFIGKTGPEKLKESSSPDLDDADTYYAGLQGFNQVVIPLGINYRLNKRFNINTGIKFRYTYSEKIDRVLKSKAQQKISNNQSVENTFFNNSNLGIYTGLTYDLNDHVSLTLDTEWGLYSLISNKHLNDPGYRKYDLSLVSFASSFKF